MKVTKQLVYSIKLRIGFHSWNFFEKVEIERIAQKNKRTRSKNSVYKKKCISHYSSQIL